MLVYLYIIINNIIAYNNRYCNYIYIGYDWCVASVKNSEYAKLATDLEINKAVWFLKRKQLPEAIETLKSFEKDSNIAINAAINLSFIYYLVNFSINLSFFLNYN